MAKKPKGPRSFSNAVVKARTGKSTVEWNRILDRWGAKKKGHTLAAKYLAKRYRLGPWWSQMVTVRYEYARRLR